MALTRSLALLVVIILVLIPTVLSDCATDWDCSLGGECDVVTSTCHCDVWWTGAQCQHLRLQPAARRNGLNLAVNTTTWRALTSPAPTHTWCMSIQHDPVHGDYFAVVSYILLHCTLDAWTTNSQVVTVRSKSPFGPFDPATMEVIVPPFSHNPKVVRYVDGTFLIFFIGTLSGSVNATNCTAANASLSSSPSRLSLNPGNDGARVVYAKSSTGPWTLHNGGAPLFSPNDSVWYRLAVTNPAPLVLPNGTVLLYFTGNPDSVRAPNTGNAIAVARAPHWSGPYTVLDTLGGLTSPDAEDPVVFRDPRGRYHMLMNTNTGHWEQGNLTGLYTGHAWSEDGLTWSEQYLGSVTTTVHFDDGSRTVFSYRERPDVLLDAEGRPIALATGMTAPDGYYNSFSWVQPICTCSEPTQLCYGGSSAPTPCGKVSSTTQPVVTSE